MLKIGSNIGSVKKAMRMVVRGQASAFVAALNKTAFEIRDAERKEMEKVFDRPTAYTMNSAFYRYATLSTLTSYVAIKNSDTKFHYLLPQINGGNRPQKRYEFMLRRAGILGASEVTVPALGAGAQTDKYGNMKSSQIVEILSQLKAFYLAGSQQNETAASKARNIKKNYKARYFVARKGESKVGLRSWQNGEKVQHLKSGIWARYKTAFGTSIKPVLFFVPKASYRKRFDFYGVAEKTAKEQFPKKLAETRQKFIERTLDTSKTGTKWY